MPRTWVHLSPVLLLPSVVILWYLGFLIHKMQVMQNYLHIVVLRTRWATMPETLSLIPSTEQTLWDSLGDFVGSVCSLRGLPLFRNILCSTERTQWRGTEESWDMRWGAFPYSKLNIFKGIISEMKEKQGDTGIKCRSPLGERVTSPRLTRSGAYTRTEYWAGNSGSEVKATQASHWAHWTYRSSSLNSVWPSFRIILFWSGSLHSFRLPFSYYNLSSQAVSALWSGNQV